MGRWSILLFCAAVSATPGVGALAQGRGPAAAASARPVAGPGAVPNPGQLRAQPFSGASPSGRLTARPVSGPGAVPNAGQLPRQPFAGTPGEGFARAYRRRGFAGAAIVGDEVGFTTYGGDVTPEEYGELPPPPLRVIPGIGPAAACAPPPQIIKVGRGLLHPARTRVVYGAPPCSDR